MKLTLLQLTQDMLDAIDAEKVTSVSDTTEADMCVDIANRCYEQLIVSKKWRFLKRFITLQSSAALNELVAPDGTIAVDPEHVYYNGQLVYYVTPEWFLEMCVTRFASDTNVTVINGMNIYNDRLPQFFTSDDDATLIFDAIPDAVDGLDASTTSAIGWVHPTNRLVSDAEYFDLPAVFFPALEIMCIATVITELKGDSQTGQAKMRQAEAAISRLARNGRFIDLEDDIRKYIVPRRTYIDQSVVDI
jgi:hypothetical protein